MRGHLGVWFLLILFWGTEGGYHSLDPLTEPEIELTTQTIKKSHGEVDWIYVWITLNEPKKSDLLPFFLNDEIPPEGLIPRESFAVLIDRKSGLVYEAVVNLSKDAEIVSWTEQPEGTDPFFATDLDAEIADAALADSTVQKRFLQYGPKYSNTSLIYPEVTKYGYSGNKPGYRNKRIAQVNFFARSFDYDNFYAHPMGFVAVVDCIALKVLDIEELPIQTGFGSTDRQGDEIPLKNCNYDPKVSGRLYRSDVSPIKLVQDNGASFKVNGNLVEWQKWKMRVGRNSFEGMFLHHVSYNDNGIYRPLFYRMSLVELFVPYGDPRPPYQRKMGFDFGDYGIGFDANELSSPDECPGSSVYFMNFIQNDKEGRPFTIPNSVCIYEEDAGILWRKQDPQTLRLVTVRSQRLVLTFIVTSGNYDYQIKWMFHQDASIKFEVTLTGIVSQNLFASGATAGSHGTLVLPQILASHHQHQFVVRLDTEIDGNKNTVDVVDILPAPKPMSSTNPFGNGIIVRSTTLKTVAGARTNARPETARTWKILGEPGNIHETNGNRKAWKLIPEHLGPRPFIPKESPLHARSAFTDFDFWVTPYTEGQLYPGGLYLNNSGLAEWVADDPERSIENTDIVVWYVFGSTHVVRAEDLPVMPTETIGFWLKPSNFFLENPAIDVLPNVHEPTN